MVFVLFHACPSLAQVDYGHIVVGRDVPLRNAFVPGEPGATVEVRTAPDYEVFAGALKDPVPLSDERAAAIQASRPDQALGGFSTGFINPTEPLERQQSQAVVTGGHGSFAGTIGNAIGTGTSAIQQGVSAIGTALSAAGGRP